MYRREALGRLAAVGVAALAGCGSVGATGRDGPRPPEAPEGSGPSGGAGGSDRSLAVGGIDYRADDAGNLVVVVTVENGDGQSRSGTLTTTVTLGGEKLTESTDVTVEADDSEAVEIPFEVSFDDFEQDGSININLE